MLKRTNRALAAPLFLGAVALFTQATQAADILSPGYLKYEYYGNIANTPVSGLTADGRYQADTPDAVYYIPSFDSRTVLPENDHETYGARVSGFIIPDQTADYDFFISSDDASELWLSTDETTANLVKIAEETGCCNAFQDPGAAQTTAAPIHLVAGQKYAVQALFKEGGGGDFVQVAWRKTDDATPAASLSPIPGRVLAANVPAAGSATITRQPQSVSVPAGVPAVFSVGYTANFPPQIGTPVGGVITNPISIQWYRDGVAIAGPGANGPSYAVVNPSASDANAKFTAKIFVPGLATPVTSSPATLSIGTSAVAPTTGALMFEFYGNIAGASPISALTDDPRYQANTPDAVLWMSAFDTRTVLPDDAHENYGARVTGFIVPTETADYNLFLRSDDASQLWLSTDETTANLTLVAEQTGCCNLFLEPVDPSSGAANPQTTQTPINLVAGKKYAVEGLLKEGGGNDYLQVAWRKTTDNTPAASLTPIPGANLASYPPAATVTISQQPQSINVAENSPANFSLAYTTSQSSQIGNILVLGLSAGPLGPLPNETIPTIIPEPVTIQWLENGVPIAGANGTNLTIPLAKASENNAKISARVTKLGASATTADATLTVTADTTAPTLVSITADGTLTNLTLVFSEPISAATATVLANYAVDNGLTISGVTQVNPTTVRLATSQQASGAHYNVTINNLRDTAAAGGGNVIAANTKGGTDAWVLSPGALRVDRFFNIANTAIDLVTSDPRFPNNPDDTVYWTSFGPFSAGNNYGDNYGARIYGWLLPPKDGTYKFFLRSDDASQLWLSTDETPANATLIAEQTSCCNAFTDSEGTLSSIPTDLVKGKRYYVEALLHEGGGDDYLQVAWNTPDAADINSVTGLAPIPGQYLETYVPKASVTITQPPQGVSVTENRRTTLTAAATTDSTLGGVSYQWQKNGVDIQGATSASYTTPKLALTDSGTKYTVVVLAPGAAATASAPATVTVVADTFPPVPKTAGAIQHDGAVEVGITFDEPVGAASATLASHYAIQGGTVASAITVTNQGGTINGPGDVTDVILSTTGLTPGNTYTVNVSGIADVKGNTMTAATPLTFTVPVTQWASVGSPTIPAAVVPVGTNGFDVVSGGRQYWGAYDEITFVYVKKTNDFDMKVQVVDQDFSSQWGRGGFAVREATDEGITIDQTADVNNPAPPVTPYVFSAYREIHANPNQTHADVNLTANNSFEANQRVGVKYGSTDGTDNTSGWLTGNAVAPAYPNVWLRLQRLGDNINGYRSTNGIDWLQIASSAWSNAPAVLLVGPGYGPENANAWGAPDGTDVNTGALNVTKYLPYMIQYRNFGDTSTQTGGGGGTLAFNATTLTSGKVNISWTGTGTLQQAIKLTGSASDWSDVSPAPTGSSYTVNTPTGNLFFRLRQP